MDGAPHEVEVPPEPAAALERDARARRAWATLSYSHRREDVNWIGEAMRDETLRKLVEQSIERLLDLSTRPREAKTLPR